MKRLMFVSLVALGLATTARPAKADCAFEYSCARHLSFVHTTKNRCFSFSSHSNGLPATSHCGYGGPAPWGGLAAYGAPAYGYGAYAAPVVAAPAAAAPAATTTPAFKAPQPAPASNSSNGVQQAGYFYYGPSSNAGYGYNAGYNYYGTGYGYGYGYGASYAQAPNYWY